MSVANGRDFKVITVIACQDVPVSTTSFQILFDLPRGLALTIVVHAVNQII